MKVRLLYPEENPSAQKPLRNAEILTADLELETVMAAMASGDPFLWDVAHQTLLLPLRDPELIRYRQQAVVDCLRQPEVIREIYEITVAAVGDVMPHMPILNSVRDLQTGSYDFGPVFAPIAPYLAKPDYTLANLETRLAGPGPGFSGYPRLNSPAELAYALKGAGVDLLATANNHSLDLGWDGITGTLDRLDAAGLALPSIAGHE